MTLKSELDAEVTATFRTAWDERDGRVVPEAKDLALGNDALKLTATVLYADLADSTSMVDRKNRSLSAEVYKTFLHCAARIIRSEDGTITAYDGDRIMAVYIGNAKNTSAVRSALKVRFAVPHIIMAAQKKVHGEFSHEIKHVCGIDTSELYIARTGVRGDNDLVWVGRAANYAAKLSSLPGGYTYITNEIYTNMNEKVKLSGGNPSINMWEGVQWDKFDDRPIYRSSWWWSVA